MLMILRGGLFFVVIQTCAANNNCHLIVDGSQSGKILNIAK